MSKTSEQNDNVKIEWNETTVEVHKAEEGLNVLDFARGRPVENDLDLVFRHRELIRRQNVAKIFHGVSVELALQSLGVKTVETKASKDLLDMLPMLLQRIRVDQDIIEVDDNAVIKHVTEDVVHESLKSSKSIGKIFGDDQPLE